MQKLNHLWNIRNSWPCPFAFPSSWQALAVELSYGLPVRWQLWHSRFCNFLLILISGLVYSLNLQRLRFGVFPTPLLHIHHQTYGFYRPQTCRKLPDQSCQPTRASVRTKQTENGSFHHMTIGPVVSGLTSSRATTRPHSHLFSTARLPLPRLTVSAFFLLHRFQSGCRRIRRQSLNGLLASSRRLLYTKGLEDTMKLVLTNTDSVWRYSHEQSRITPAETGERDIGDSSCVLTHAIV